MLDSGLMVGCCGLFIALRVLVVLGGLLFCFVCCRLAFGWFCVCDWCLLFCVWLLVCVMRHACLLIVLWMAHYVFEFVVWMFLVSV